MTPDHQSFAVQVAATVIVMLVDRWMGKSQSIKENSILEFVENKSKAAIKLVSRKKES
jgi:hypothetical protein